MNSRDVLPVLLQLAYLLLPLAPLAIGAAVVWVARVYNANVHNQTIKADVATFVRWADQKFADPAVKEAKVVAAIHDKYPMLPESDIQRLLEAAVFDIHAGLQQFAQLTAGTTPLPAVTELKAYTPPTLHVTVSAAPGTQATSGLVAPALPPADPPPAAPTAVPAPTGPAPGSPAVSLSLPTGNTSVPVSDVSFSSTAADPAKVIITPPTEPPAPQV